VVFAAVNGGLLLYSKNAVDHAADVGMVTLAAEGNCSNGPNCPTSDADQVALTRMRNAGLGTTSLVSVASITVTREFETSNGTIRDFVQSDAPSDRNCTNFPCENIYSLNGSASRFYWPPANRLVNGGANGSQVTSDFAKVSVAYTYHFFGTSHPDVNVTVVKVLRLEPQQ